MKGMWRDRQGPLFDKCSLMFLSAKEFSRDSGLMRSAAAHKTDMIGVFCQGAVCII